MFITMLLGVDPALLPVVYACAHHTRPTRRTAPILIRSGDGTGS